MTEREIKAMEKRTILLYCCGTRGRKCVHTIKDDKATCHACGRERKFAKRGDK